MPLTHAIVLGIFQGLTEFLPVSSSAHLELVPWFFGWEHFGGDATREQAFDVALHVGTLVGAVSFLKSDIATYGGAALRWVARVASKRSREPNNPSAASPGLDRDARVGFLLVLSVIPAAVVGVVLEDVLLDLGEQTMVIAVLLLVGGWLLWWADRRANTKTVPSSRQSLSTPDFDVAAATWLGIAQACALVPGVSRSGAIITAGRLLRFDRLAAVRIAFLMSLPVIAGAAVFRGFGLIGENVPSEDWAAMGVGAAVAAATAWLVLWLIVRLLTGRLFTGVALYRTALAITAATVFLAGWR